RSVGSGAVSVRRLTLTCGEIRRAAIGNFLVRRAGRVQTPPVWRLAEHEVVFVVERVELLRGGVVYVQRVDELTVARDHHANHAIPQESPPVRDRVVDFGEMFV